MELGHYGDVAKPFPSNTAKHLPRKFGPHPYRQSEDGGDHGISLVRTCHNRVISRLNSYPNAFCLEISQFFGRGDNGVLFV
jgi:hypothetical protein